MLSRVIAKNIGDVFWDTVYKRWLLLTAFVMTQTLLTNFRLTMDVFSHTTQWHDDISWKKLNEFVQLLYIALLCTCLYIIWANCNRVEGCCVHDTTQTSTMAEEQIRKFADNEVAREVKSALVGHKEDSGWEGVERFIDWIRTKVGS